MHIKLLGLFCTLWFCFVPIINASERLVPLDAAGLESIIIKEQNNIVLINFWATWCRPCLEEIPILMKLEKELKESGFRLVSVSLDEPESADILVNPFIQKWFPGFSSYLSFERDMDSMVSVVDAAWNEILPTSYLLNKNGTMVHRIQGSYSSEEFSKMILPLIE